MSENIKFGKIFSSKTGIGATSQGVGNKEVESHFTFDKNKGFHVSTYLNDYLMSNLEKTNQKIKVNQTNF